MRAMVSLLGLVAVLVIVGLLAKKQLGAVAPAPSPAFAGQPAGMTPQQQVQQVRQAAEAALQAPRPMPDDSK